MVRILAPHDFVPIARGSLYSPWPGGRRNSTASTELEESLSQSALAMAKRISRQVAFYQLKPVRRFLRENLDNPEFPQS